MKTIQILFICVIMLLSINTISAQYGNGGYNNGYGGGGYGGNGYGGSGSGRMSQMNQDRSHDKPKEIAPEVTVGKIMDKMKVDIILDELQVIAISNVLLESLRTQGILLKQEVSQDEKIKNFQALSENTDRQINAFLNNDQKAKYLLFKEDRKNPKKSKKQK